jgi:hypothetical protein
MPNQAQSDSFPAPANATRQPIPARLTQTIPVYLSRNQSFVLDSDLALALEDMAAASGEPWVVFIQKAVNDSLRNWLGR